MPTFEEILNSIAEGAGSSQVDPGFENILNQMVAEYEEAESAWGQNPFSQFGSRLAGAASQFAALPARALGIEPHMPHKIPVKTPTTTGQKVGAFLGEVAPEVAMDIGMTAATGGLGVPGQMIASGTAGFLGDKAQGGSGLRGAVLGAAIPFGFSRLFGRFGKKAVGELFELTDVQLKEILEEVTLRAQDPASAGMDFDQLFMNRVGYYKSRKYIPQPTRPYKDGFIPGDPSDIMVPPVTPRDIDPITLRVWGPPPEIRQTLNLPEGKIPAQLPMGDISFNTLFEAAGTGNTPAFRNALSMLGRSVDEVNDIVQQTTVKRGPGGRFQKAMSPKQRGKEYIARLEEEAGGRPAGTLSNHIDVVDEGLFRATYGVTEKLGDQMTLPGMGKGIVEEAAEKLPPPGGVPGPRRILTAADPVTDVGGYLDDVTQKGADLTKATARVKAGRPFVKPAGIKQKTVIPSFASAYDKQIAEMLRTSGVPKPVTDAIMGVSRTSMKGVRPLTQVERIVVGKSLQEGTDIWKSKLKAIIDEVEVPKQKKTKGRVHVAETVRARKGILKRLLGDEGGFASFAPKTDISPLTGQPGVETVNRLTEYLSPEMRQQLLERLMKNPQHLENQNILALWYNALLTNPATWNRNIFGNMLEFAEQMVTRTAKGLIRGSVKQATAQWTGFGNGLLNAWKTAGEAWRTGLIEDVRKGTEKWAETATDAPWQKWMPSSKVMSFMDDFFTTTAYHMDLQDRLTRQAFQMGGNVADNLVKLNKFVPPELSDAAMKSSRRVVYRDLAENKLEAALLDSIKSFQDIPVFGRFFLPFGPTLMRIGKRVTEYTPMGYFAGAYNMFTGNARKVMEEGVDIAQPYLPGMGPEMVSKGALQMEKGLEQVLRSMYGAVTLTSLSYLAKNGYITGGMKDLTASQRDAVRAGGMQPMSVKIRDRWVSYRNLGPLTGLLQMVANSVEDIDSGKYTPWELGVKIPANVAAAALDATFLPNLVQAAHSLIDPDRHGVRGWESNLNYLQPSTGLAALARAIDPVVREKDKLDPVDAFRARMPGLSQQLRPRLGLFGEELKRTYTNDPTAAQQIFQFLTPLQAKRVTSDPLIAEVARLKASMGAPSMDLDIPTLTPDDKWQASKAMGMLQREMANRVFNSPFYQGADDESKRAVFEKGHTKARQVINTRVKQLTAQGKSITYRALLKGLVAE